MFSLKKKFQKKEIQREEIQLIRSLLLVSFYYFFSYTEKNGLYIRSRSLGINEKEDTGGKNLKG